jgi:hypothetical protein
VPSPYEEALDLAGLHPKLSAYFAEIPAGMVGRGTGTFDVVGTRKRWLWPVLAVLGRQGVVFAHWGRNVHFDVVNEPFDEVLSGRRTFHFARGDRTMVDLMSVVDGRLVDDLGHARRYRAQLRATIDDGAMVLASTRFAVRIFRAYLRIPGRVVVTERWDDTVERQHVSVVITTPLLGRLYEYSGHFDYRLEPADA